MSGIWRSFSPGLKVIHPQGGVAVMDQGDILFEEGVLPMRVDNGELITCVGISGGAAFINEMPERLTLMRRTPDGAEIYAVYVQKSVWRPEDGDVRQGE